MAKIIHPGQTLHTFRVEKEITRGHFANCYEARGADGSHVFLKQYKTPKPIDQWYNAFREHSAELRRRLEGGNARGFTVKVIDLFEARHGMPTFFQAFEFMTGGKDLKAHLEEARERPSALAWDTRMVFAMVLLSAIHHIHEAGIVHGDLKPENILLFPDRSIVTGYRLRVIDMDFALLVDKEAPWPLTEIGYVGTEGYLSPEHVNHTRPLPASDVFTCGIILYELLIGRHPFLGAEDFATAVKYGRFPRNVRLIGKLPKGNDAAALAAILASLSPRSEDRPTAKELREILNERNSHIYPVPPEISKPVEQKKSSASVVVPPPPPLPEEQKPTGTRPPSAPLPSNGRIALCGPSGKRRVFALAAVLGSTTLADMGDGANYFNEQHFSLEPSPSGWRLVPRPGTANETILNGDAVTGPVLLSSGDVIAVGKVSKGKIFCPLKVEVG